MTATERRYELNSRLEEILGSSNVYYQPPENLKLRYPCIIYDWDGQNDKFANNGNYNSIRRYSIMVVEKEPDSDIPDKVAQLPLCSFNRRYINDNLYHTVYSIYI